MTRANPYVEYGTGFVDLDNNRLELVVGPPIVFTLKNDGDYEVATDGVSVHIDADIDLTITGFTPTEGESLYIDLVIDTVAGSVTLVEAASISEMTIAQLYLSETVPNVIHVADMRRGTDVSFEEEKRFNNRQNIEIVSGGLVTGYTLDEDSDGAVELGFVDEESSSQNIDIYNGLTRIRVSHNAVNAWDWKQYILQAAQIPRWKRVGGAILGVGTDAAPIWQRDFQADVPFLNTGGGTVVFDSWNGTNWTLKAAASGNYLVHFLLLVNDPEEPVISIAAAAEYTTLLEAQAVTFTDILSANWGTFPFSRIAVLAKTILRTNAAYTDAYKAIWKEIVDYRNIDVGRYAYDQNISSLSGRTADDALPQYALKYPTAVVHTGGGTLELDDVDDAGKLFLMTTATATFNLPVAPSDGYTVSFALMGAAITLTVDHNGKNIIAFPNGMTAAETIEAGDSGSFVTLRFIAASNLWAMTEGLGEWTGKVAAAIVSRHAFTGCVANGVENNFVTVDAYGNIKDSTGNIAAGAPEDVTKAAAAVGVSVDLAREDHKHDVSTAAAGTIRPGDAVADGAATSLSRSDHKHGALGAEVVIATPHTIATDVVDVYIPYSLTAATAVTIPASIEVVGRKLFIKDSGRNCSVFNISVISATGGVLIEGEASALMDIDGMCLVIGFDGTNWNII